MKLLENIARCLPFVVISCLSIVPILAQPYLGGEHTKVRTNWRVPDKLRIGDAAPDFKLKTKDFTREVELSSFKGKRPVVLIFGSYSCPSFRSQAGLFEEMFGDYKDRAEFFIVYIRESNAIGGAASSINEREGIAVKDPQDYLQRTEVAKLGCSALNIQTPCLVDRIDDAVAEAYSAWPDRIYIVDTDGKIAYVGKPGPSGFAQAVQFVDAWLDRR
ncbi:MAG: redoxin domain-containing protein [Candidatus Obscuribacterales bacterium]|nr:redoxin domain-containing protein [Candidatus Obscuribacterales bacterium]